MICAADAGTHVYQSLDDRAQTRKIKRTALNGTGLRVRHCCTHTSIPSVVGPVATQPSNEHPTGDFRLGGCLEYAVAHAPGGAAYPREIMVSRGANVRMSVQAIRQGIGKDRQGGCDRALIVKQILNVRG